MDLRTKQLHFLGEGEPTIVLPPGSETFQLESASSGHLLLPCSEFQHAANATQGEHHLFNDETTAQRDPQPSPCDQAPASADTHPLDTVHSEEMCLRALQSFNIPSAADTVSCIVQGMSTPCVLGATVEQHSGTVQTSDVSKDHPRLTQVATCIMQAACGEQAFTSIMLESQVPDPACAAQQLSRDAYMLIPLKLPSSGVKLWTELREGDTVRGPVEVRTCAGVMLAGQMTSLQVGQPVEVNRHVWHAVHSQAKEQLVLLKAYCTDLGAASSTAKRELSDLGFAVPHTAVLQPQPISSQAVVDAAELDPQPSPHDQVPRRSGSPVSCSAPRVKSKAYTSTPGRQLLRRVLLISIFQSTVTAFMNMGWEPLRLRPLELLRDGFDSSLKRIKDGEFHAMWIDLADARQWAGQERTKHVCSRLSVAVSCAERHSVPVVFAASRRTAWQHPAVDQLVKQREYHVSYHCWCVAKASIQPGIVSSVKHRVLSSLKIVSHNCQCSPQVEHVFDLDVHRGPGYANARSKAECAMTMKIVAALGNVLPSPAAPESSKQSDPICNSQTYVCTACGSVRDNAHCMSCEGASFVSVPNRERPVLCTTEAPPLPYAPNSSVNVVSSAQAFAEPPEQQASFPTDQKIQQKQQRQELHAQGHSVHTRKRKKVVEQHFDDCGDDLSSLALATHEFLVECSSGSEDEGVLDEAVSWITPQLNLSVTWGWQGSAVAGPPEVHRETMLATTLEEMYLILSNPSHMSWGVEIVELCGGQALTTYLCVRRRLQGGHCFELITGCDLTDATTQRKVIGYLDVAKPLVVVMSPICAPFGPLGARNQVLNHDAWSRYPSALYRVEPWPQVRMHETCLCVVFDQCMTGLTVAGMPARKRTELVSNAREVLEKFAHLRCDGTHAHADLLGGNARHAQKWPYNMCNRIAAGIEALVKQLMRQRSPSFLQCVHKVVIPPAASQAFPSQASGPEDPGEVAVSEPWRKCKGCLWRLHKYDKLHSRIRGECKHPDVVPGDFSCPGCIAHKPRADSTHTYGPDCRHALTNARTSVRRRPMGRVPAHAEPTAGLRASDLGVRAEQEAEKAEPSSASGIRRPNVGDVPLIPIEESENAEPSSASGIRRPDAHAAPPVAADEPVEDSRAREEGPRAGRGPDQSQRVRRTWSEADTQTPVPSDWTSFDVQSSIRGLRHGTEAARRQILRKLHLRWWHCSTDKMCRFLRAAGLGKDILELVPAIQDTCRVCRHWARPSADAKATCRMVIGFNIEVEGDLMFYRHQGQQQIILVLADRGVRWITTSLVADRQTATLLTALDVSWVSVFGPMQVLVFDGETGLDDDESTTFFQLRGITKRTAAPRQHTRIVDRKIQVLRDSVHKIASQLSEEGLQVPFRRILAETTFALNALSSVNGLSPYTAVLGRVPSLLPHDDTVTSDAAAAEGSRHMCSVSARLPCKASLRALPVNE